MNRRSFFKTVLGLASVAVIGLPKVEAAPIEKSSEDLKTFKVMKNRFTGLKPGEIHITASQTGGGRSFFHEELRDRSKCHVYHRGFLYTYSHVAYEDLMHKIKKVRAASDGNLGNCGSYRLYLADKIVRVSDGKVFKSRYTPTDGSVTEQDWDELRRGGRQTI